MERGKLALRYCVHSNIWLLNANPALSYAQARAGAFRESMQYAVIVCVFALSAVNDMEIRWSAAGAVCASLLRTAVASLPYVQRKASIAISTPMCYMTYSTLAWVPGVSLVVLRRQTSRRVCAGAICLAVHSCSTRLNTYHGTFASCTSRSGYLRIQRARGTSPVGLRSYTASHLKALYRRTGSYQFRSFNSTISKTFSLARNHRLMRRITRSSLKKYEWKQYTRTFATRSHLTCKLIKAHELLVHVALVYTAMQRIALPHALFVRVAHHRYRLAETSPTRNASVCRDVQ